MGKRYSPETKIPYDSSDKGCSLWFVKYPNGYRMELWAKDRVDAIDQWELLTRRRFATSGARVYKEPKHH